MTFQGNSCIHLRRNSWRNPAWNSWRSTEGFLKKCCYLFPYYHTSHKKFVYIKIYSCSVTYDTVVLLSNNINIEVIKGNRRVFDAGMGGHTFYPLFAGGPPIAPNLTHFYLKCFCYKPSELSICCLHQRLGVEPY